VRDFLLSVIEELEEVRELVDPSPFLLSSSVSEIPSNP
jgi:hypothetical protein